MTLLNGEFLNSYWADGLIVSTPTDQQDPPWLRRSHIDTRQKACNNTYLANLNTQTACYTR
jgi:hypothetical protein